MKRTETICHIHALIQDKIDSLTSAANSILSELDDIERCLSDAIQAGQNMEDAIHERNKTIRELEEKGKL